MSPSSGSPITSSPLKTRVGFAVLLAILFLLLVWPVILSRSTALDKTGAAGDEVKFHLPTIYKMEKAWPHPDLSDLGGAQMTPTFHVLMAVTMHYGKTGVTGIRLVNSLSGLLLVVVVFWYASKWTDAPTAFALCLPYLFSPFMLSSAMWLMTDNMAFLFVALALACAAMFPPTPGRILGGGIAAMAATAVRQLHIWLIAPIAVASFFELMREKIAILAAPVFASPTPEPATRPGKLVVCTAIAILAPIAALMFYVVIWHGLLPPTAQLSGLHNHFTIVPLAFAQAGFCAFFLAPAVLEGPLWRFLKDRRVWAGALLCLALAAIPHTQEPPGPSGALTELSHTPVLFGRILILLPPAALAGAAFAAFWIAAAEKGRGRAAFIILFGFLCWLAAQTVPVYALRRYCDIILVMVIWLAAMSLTPRPRRLRFWIWTGAFALVQAGMAVIQIYRPVMQAR